MSNRYRSKFEARVAEDLAKKGQTFAYEDRKLDYLEPAKNRKYTVDFSLECGIIVECKGRLTAADRKKMLLVKDQHPDKDIRMLFQRASNPIYTGSNTTYAQWADNNGFKWAEGSVPEEWLNEVVPS